MWSRSGGNRVSAIRSRTNTSKGCLHEPCGLGECACRAVQVGEPSGEGGDSQPMGQGFAYFSPFSACSSTSGRHRRCAASAVAAVHISRVKVSPEPDGTVVEVLFLVSDAGERGSEGGVGTESRPGPPADVDAAAAYDRGRRMRGGVAIISDLHEDAFGALSDLHLWVCAQQHIPCRTGETGNSRLRFPFRTTSPARRSPPARRSSAAASSRSR